MTATRVVMSLAELVLVARMSGDLSLPFTPRAACGRLSARLTGTRPHPARAALAAELERVDDEGPDGAAVALARRGLLTDAGPDLLLAAVLGDLAEASLAAVLDVATTGEHGTRALRAWWAVGEDALSGLVLRGPTTVELVSAPLQAWGAELARLVPDVAIARVDPVTLTSEAFLGALAAHRRGRPGLAAALAPGDEALLHALAARCRGRLRLLVVRRPAAGPPAVTAWVLLDDGWRSLRALPGARVEVAGRRPLDLGLASYPWARGVA